MLITMLVIVSYLPVFGVAALCGLFARELEPASFFINLPYAVSSIFPTEMAGRLSVLVLEAEDFGANRLGCK